MSIVKELEALSALRERGDLTAAEFAQAKQRVLTGNAHGATTAGTAISQALSPQPLRNQPDHKRLIAILSTVALAFSATSAAIAPAPLSLLAFALFATACTLNWASYFRREMRESAV